MQHEEETMLLEHVKQKGKRFTMLVSGLSILTLVAICAYFHQYRQGLSVTGLSRQIFWGVYITNFVFFIGISHAGTLISAILRLAKAEWRRPITRSAEVITVLVLFFGVGSIIFDLGKPDRVLNLFRYPQFQSPLMWDIICITLYLTASSLFLYLGMIPDIAIQRDHRFKPQWFYKMLSLGWEGTPAQHRRLNKGITFMSVLVIMVAVSVHTVISYIFAMTVQPMWHSTIFGPYFVTGAIFSGIAALIVGMAVIRKAYHLEAYLKPIHFNNLGLLLLLMSLLWFYFTFSEYLTEFYGEEPARMVIFWSKLSGEFAPLFWGMFLCCFVIPLCLLSFNKTRTVRGTTIASVFILIGMWVERYLIVVPTLTSQRMPVSAASYSPTWVEWLLLAGSISFFVLLYTVFTKIFPIVAIWEIKEGREKSLRDFRERLKSYLPGKNLHPQEE